MLGRRLGSYVIERPLSSAAHASVFAGRHVHLNREVAVRFLAPELQRDPEYPKRFVAEARTLAGVQHKNLLELLDIGEIDGRSYCVSEFGRGQSLRALLASSTRLPPGQVIRYVSLVCEGLSAAHAAGLVHRDLRPEHIFVHEGASLSVKLGGFGSTPVLPADGERTGTQILSSPRYAAPEQANTGPHGITAAADLYSVGAMAFELLTGRPVFEHDSDAMLLVMHLRDAVPRLRERCPDVSPELADAIERCLSKSPAARPSAAALVKELAQANEFSSHEKLGLTASTTASFTGASTDGSLHDLTLNETHGDAPAPSGTHPHGTSAALEAVSEVIPIAEPVAPKAELDTTPEPAKAHDSAEALDTPLSGAGQSTLKKLTLRMRRKGDFPAFSQNVGEVSKRADASSVYSASQLGDSILNDFALTAKLLRVVNSTYANRFGGKIYRVQHAIVILGFDRIRSLALGISLFKGSHSDPQAARISDSAVSSLVSGEIARQLAREIGVNDEEAMVCAMFRNLGRHLVLIHLPELYDRVVQVAASEKLTERQAAEKVLGMSFGRLGVEIAETWRLPARMLASIACRPSAGSSLVRPEDKLNALSEFASDVCELIANEPPATRKAKLSKLLLQHKDLLKLTADELLERLVSVEQAFKDRYASVMGPEVRKSRLLKAVAQLSAGGNEAAGQAPLFGSPGSPAAVHAAPEELDRSPGIKPQVMPLQLAQAGAKPALAKQAPGRSDPLPNQWAARLDELRAQVRAGSSGDRLLSAALRLASDLLGTERLLVLSATQNKAELGVRFGLRDDLEAIVREFKVPLHPTRNVNVFYTAYHSGRDVVITDAFAAKSTASVPVSYYEVLGSPAFALYGCLAKGLPPALLLAEAGSAAELPSSERAPMLAELRTWLAQGAASRS